MRWSTETKMNVGWIDPGLLRDFQAEGTDAHRLCTIEDGWVERFGSDVLLSFKRVLARERLLEELQTWADWVDVHVRRVFARFIPRENERREPPALVVGDPGESLQTVATERSLKFGLDFRHRLFAGSVFGPARESPVRASYRAKATAELLCLHLFLFRVRGM